MVGTNTSDDAGVYRLTDDLALVQTVDFFPPLVDDPFVFGQIAATNALSDVYAMGGAPKTALNITAFPDDQLPLSLLQEILRGGLESAKRAGCVILGGHTVRDTEIKYGLAVTGVIHPSKIKTNAGAKAGDRLILTKPLGTGFITTAYKKGKCPEDILLAATQSMIQLNSAGCTAMVELDASAATDITGFGLLGHAFGMAHASKKSLTLFWDRLPKLPGVDEFIQAGHLTRANRTNENYVRPHLEICSSPPHGLLELFFDPQTSGGLLISIPAERAQALISKALAAGASTAVEVGFVSDSDKPGLVITHS